MSKKINISLISTHSEKHQGDVIHEPLGIEVLSGYLQGKVPDVGVKLFDTQLSSVEEILENLEITRPDLIGISVKPGTAEKVRNILQKIKEKMTANLLNKDTVVVLGGSMMSIKPEFFMEEFPNVLVGIQNGEYTLEGLVHYIQGKQHFNEIPNLVYTSSNGEIIKTSKKKFDMGKDWTIPDRQLTKEVLLKGGIIRAEAATRSCDKGCTFCSVHKLHRGGFQAGDAHKVVEDLKQLVELGVEIVNFSDDEGWTDDMKTMIEIANLIIEENIDIKRTISTRVDKIVPENITPKGQEEIIDNIKLLQSSGLSKLFLGIESGSDSQLLRYNKGVTATQNEQAIYILNDIGIDYTAGFIIFDFLMNREELQENINFLRRTGLYKKITNPFSIIRVYDGTVYKRKLEREGLLLGVSEFDPLLYKGKFKDEKIGRIAEIVEGLTEEFYKEIFAIKSRIQGVDNVNAVELLNEIREIDMSVLEELFNASKSGVLDDIVVKDIKNRYISSIQRLLNTTL